jgi:hypothetical protein
VAVPPVLGNVSLAKQAVSDKVTMANPGMAKLYNSSDFSDVVVSCGRLRIKAHKNVLCSHSDTFRTAFHNQEGWAVISSTCIFASISYRTFGR